MNKKLSTNNNAIASLMLAFIDTMKTMKVKEEDQKKWLDLVIMNFKKYVKNK